MIINEGASLGLVIPFLELFSLFLLVFLGRWWWQEKRSWGLVLIILGGVLNLIERICFGGVRDYWQIPGTTIYNNLNDYFIGIGVVQVIWYLIWKKRQK